jgi:hypothetical protein
VAEKDADTAELPPVDPALVAAFAATKAEAPPVAPAIVAPRSPPPPPPVDPWARPPAPAPEPEPPQRTQPPAAFDRPAAAAVKGSFYAKFKK